MGGDGEMACPRCPLRADTRNPIWDGNEKGGVFNSGRKIVMPQDPENENTTRLYNVYMQLQRKSSCHKAPVIIEPTDGSTWVRPYCSKCDTQMDTLSRSEFVTLPIFVRCPSCGPRMHPESPVQGKPYRYVCPDCGQMVSLSEVLLRMLGP